MRQNVKSQAPPPKLPPHPLLSPSPTPQFLALTQALSTDLVSAENSPDPGRGVRNPNQLRTKSINVNSWRASSVPVSYPVAVGPGSVDTWKAGR